MPAPEPPRLFSYRQPGAMSNAAAVRRCKLRKKAGIGILQVELPLGPLADQLVDDKFLAEWDTEDQAEI